MQLVLILILFVGIAIMTTLIFIGYSLYSKGKQTLTINDMLASKESDLIDLYNSLEQMMDEIEQYTNQAKSEIYEQREQIKLWHSEIFEKTIETKPSEKQIYEALKLPKTSAPPKRRETDEEKLMKRAEKTRDFKGTKVRTLYNKGMPVSDIAKEMNIGQGEVQLLLNIKNKII